MSLEIYENLNKYKIDENDEKIEVIAIESSEFAKISIIVEKIKNDFIGILHKFLPAIRNIILEREWTKFNLRWQKQYGSLANKFDTLSENDFIQDKEILDKFEALRYIGQFKNCTIPGAITKISKITKLINVDYIIYNDRITGFTYVLIKDICDFLTLEISKLDKGSKSLDKYYLELVYDVAKKLDELTCLFSKLFLSIDPLAIYIATQKNSKLYKKLNFRKKYLAQQLNVLNIIEKEMLQKFFS